MGIEDEREALVGPLVSMYEGAKTRVKVDSELSEEFEVKVGMYYDFFCSCG